MFDIALQRAATRTVDGILEERGIAFFLVGPGRRPIVDERRLEIALSMACRELPHEPDPQARASCLASIRRRVEELAATLAIQARG